MDKAAENQAMTKIGLGVIGLGYVGKIHLHHSLKLANVNLVAACDLSKNALRKAKNSGAQKTFNNYEHCLKDSNINAVIIALPTHLHLQCAIQAAEAKKHIFLEKPIARNVSEAKEIISAAERNSVKLMVGYPMRFNTTFRSLKEKIKSGMLGDIEVAQATYVSSGPFMHRAEEHTPQPVPEWWFEKELTGGGALIDLGSHMINLLRWYFGEITDIKGYFGHRFNMDLEDSALCIAKFESGTLASISVGWFSTGYQLKVDLSGTVQNESAEHVSPNRLITVAQMLMTGTSGFYRSHLDELQHFVTCLINDCSPSPSGQEGLKDLEVIARAYKNQIRLSSSFS